jgi:hypothetical protein
MVEIETLAFGTLVAGFALGRDAGVVEARLLRRLQNGTVAHNPADPDELLSVGYLNTVATDPRNY